MKYFIAIIFIVTLLAIYPFFLYGSAETVHDCVIKTERVNSGEDSKYLVFSKNEVYENTDSLLRLKFNSSDFYRDIQAGKCYTFKVQGWRIPFVSGYRNIYEIVK